MYKVVEIVRLIASMVVKQYSHKLHLQQVPFEMLESIYNFIKEVKVKTDICIAPHSKKLTAEALRCGSHSFHTANTPHLPLPVTFHQRAPPV